MWMAMATMFMNRRQYQINIIINLHEVISSI